MAKIRAPAPILVITSYSIHYTKLYEIRPGLTHITKLGVFTTAGASFWLTHLVGAPGKRTLMRGLRFNLSPRARTAFAVHYLMDSSTPESRARP